MGGQDGVVRPANVERLAGAIDAAGGRVRFSLYPQAGHADILLGLAPWLGDANPLARDLAAFVADPGAAVAGAAAG